MSGFHLTWGLCALKGATGICNAKAMEMTNKSWGGTFFIVAKLLPSQRAASK